MLSVTCKAAIKAVIYLGSKHEFGQKASIGEIATDINENEHTVGKLLQKLVKAGIINSTKGPSGGFSLDENQLELPLMMIVEAIDGTNIFSQCGLGLSECTASRPCPIHFDFKPVRDMFQNLCLEKKIAHLCEPVNEGVSYLMLK